MLSVDGTGHFPSSKVHCANCCEKRHKDGTTTYSHQSLCAGRLETGTRRAAPPQSPAANSSTAQARASLSASLRINVGATRTGRANPAASAASVESMIQASTTSP